VSNIDGTRKRPRAVHRHHRARLAADAITEMRDSTVYDEAANSVPDIDYNAITISPVTP